MLWIDDKKAYDIVPPRLSHKVYRENHGNLESGIDSMRKKLSRGKDPVRNLPGRCTLTITILDSHDDTQLHIQKMHRPIRTVNRRKRSTT